MCRIYKRPRYARFLTYPCDMGNVRMLVEGNKLLEVSPDKIGKREHISSNYIIHS